MLSDEAKYIKKVGDGKRSHKRGQVSRSQNGGANLQSSEMVSHSIITRRFIIIFKFNHFLYESVTLSISFNISVDNPFLYRSIHFCTGDLQLFYSAAFDTHEWSSFECF